MFAGLGWAVITGYGAAGSQFIGTWQLSGGTAITTCNGTGYTSNSTGNLVFARGTSKDLESTTSPGDLEWSANGNSLTVVPEQTCAFTETGETSQGTIPMGTVTLKAGSPATIKVVVSEAGPINGATCTYMLNATAFKVAE